MSLRWTAAGFLAFIFVGCTDPPSIVPVAPPGMEYKRNLPIPDDQAASALGETAVRKTGEAEASAPVAAGFDGLPATEPGETKTTASGLKYETIRKGDGEEAKPGRNVSVHYTGTLGEGREPFDSSIGGKPLQFKLGARKVIKGWDEGLAGMKVGEKRRLTIPPELGYGPSDFGGKIPPNATLYFEVELVDVK
ncbi:MAG: FKBP-type peptidyl-prolyl cis-trans isomerase [Isosphaeraceae bacterium]